MSIEDAVNEYVARGELHRLSAAALGGVERRRLVVSESLRRLAGGPWQDEPEERVGSRFAAALTGFIEEEFITVRQGPPANDDAQLARLEPHDVLEIRCLYAGPSIRVFGCIAVRDLFIGLAWKFRYALGRYGSPEWAAAIQECKDAWCALFPFLGPLTGGVFPDDYVSGAIAATDR